MTLWHFFIFCGIPSPKLASGRDEMKIDIQDSWRGLFFASSNNVFESFCLEGLNSWNLVRQKKRTWKPFFIFFHFFGNNQKLQSWIIQFLFFFLTFFVKQNSTAIFFSLTLAVAIKRAVFTAGSWCNKMFSFVLTLD